MSFPFSFQMNTVKELVYHDQQLILFSKKCLAKKDHLCCSGLTASIDLVSAVYTQNTDISEYIFAQET